MAIPQLTPEREAWLASLVKGDRVKICGDNERIISIVNGIIMGRFMLKNGSQFFTKDGSHVLLENTWIEPPKE